MMFFLLSKFQQSTHIHHSVVSEQSTSCCSPYDDKQSPEITKMAHSKHRRFSIYQGFLVVIRPAVALPQLPLGKDANESANIHQQYGGSSL